MTFVGCPLDERTLHPIPTTSGSAGSTGGAAGATDTDSGGSATDTGGASATGTQASSSGGSSETTGASSSGGSESTGVGGSSGGVTSTGEGGAGNDGSTGCPDLDKNSVADCEETLLENASFDANLNAWHEEINALGSWEQEDGVDSDASGSASIVNRTVYEDREGQVMRGLWQCIPASAGASYRILTQVRITGEPGQGWGGINVWFYDGPECTGNLVTASTPLLGTTIDWSMTETTADAPDTTQSMLVRLVVNKPYTTPAIAVDFDNVLIRED